MESFTNNSLIYFIKVAKSSSVIFVILFFVGEKFLKISKRHLIIIKKEKEWKRTIKFFFSHKKLPFPLFFLQGRSTPRLRAVCEMSVHYHQSNQRRG